MLQELDAEVVHIKHPINATGGVLLWNTGLSEITLSVDFYCGKEETPVEAIRALHQ